MNGMVSGDINARRAGGGASVFMVEQMLQRLDELDALESSKAERIRNALVGARQAGQKVLRTEFEYAQTRDHNSRARGNAVALDNSLDTQLTDMRDLAAIRARSKDARVAKAGQLILTTAFPRGARAITSLSFEAQLGVMQTMRKALRGELREAVETVGMTAEVARFSNDIDLFRDELAIAEKPVTSWDQVTADRERLHEMTCLVVVQVLSAFDDLDDAEAIKTREWLLAPFREQQQRVLDAYRRRRRPLDVDPATGEEILDSGPVVADPIDEDLEEEVVVHES